MCEQTNQLILEQEMLELSNGEEVENQSEGFERF